MARFVHVLNRRLEKEPHFVARRQNVKSFGIDPDHRPGISSGVLPDRTAVIVVHVLNNAGFLLGGERVRKHQFLRFDPVDLAESADESNPNWLQTKEFKIVGLLVLPRGWEVSEIAIRSVRVLFGNRPSIGEPGDAASRLDVVALAPALEHG